MSAAIDVVAKGLLNAAALIEDGRLDAIKTERYAGWDGELGQHDRAGSTSPASPISRSSSDIDPQAALGPARSGSRT